MAFFRGIFDEIAPEFPAVETERVYMDPSVTLSAGLWKPRSRSGAAAATRTIVRN
jgi:hypothetical protein